MIATIQMMIENNWGFSAVPLLLMAVFAEWKVIETYIGICMLTGDDRRLAYEYAEKLLGHPIYTHEFPKYADKLKELSKPDFIEICRKLSD